MNFCVVGGKDCDQREEEKYNKTQPHNFLGQQIQEQKMQIC